MRGGIGAFPMTSIGGNWLAKGDGLSLGPPRVGLLAESLHNPIGYPEDDVRSASTRQSTPT